MEWFHTFREAAGVRKYILLGIIVTVTTLFYKLIFIFAQNDLLSSGATANINSWVAAIALGFLIGLFLVTSWVLNYATRLRLQRKGARTALAKLRTTGVELRNIASNLSGNEDVWKKWGIRAEEWEQEVYDSIKKISEADAEWFRVLDIVPEPRLLLLNSVPVKYAQLYEWHDYRVMRLGEMVYRLWRD